MTIGLLFWVLFIVGLVFFGIGGYRDRAAVSVPGILFWVLIGLLGYAEFGSAVHK